MNFKDIERAAAELDADAGITNTKAQHDGPDFHRNAPRPNPACLYGLAGDVAKAGSETTEANRFAVALNFIVFMGCAVGRGPYMPVGNTWHHCGLFGMHIGRSGRGRKGDAVSLLRRIERKMRELNEAATPQVHSGGLSSREGLVFMIHDGFKEGKNEVPAIEDKRLLVIESEFANVLQQSKRDGNTLSPALRDCWDGVSLKPATKTSRLWATDPHVCLIAAITPSELISTMASRDLTNGFFNRFLPIWAEREKVLPFPQATPQHVVDALANRVLEVLAFCKAERWVEHDHMRLDLSPAAQKLYAQLYLGELSDNSHGERITALIERRAPMLLRLAMLFALMDLTTTVGEQHINAALAWIRYSVESVKFVFASGVDEHAVAEVNQTAQKIIDFLKRSGQATRWQLTKDCFGGHQSKAKMDAALDELLSNNPPLIEVETVPRPKSNPGSPTKIYRLAANCAISANPEYPRGFAADFVECEPSELSEVSAGFSSTVRSVRTVREVKNRPLTRADTHDPHNSHTSQANSEIGVEL
ncbi:MAG: hypothetical protein RIS44_1284 [Pseudomonadota bacterium]|jgi:hypothetical protein